MSSLFTSLINSSNALQLYGQVFNVIQNNITNANTPGYVTQTQDLVAQPFNPNEGISGGVGAGPLLSARDEYLEQAVRNQQQSLGSAQQEASDLGQIEPLFDVSGASGVPAAFNGFFNAFSELAVNPNDAASRQNVITAANQLAQAFHQNAIGISQVETNVAQQTSGAVDSINQLAGQIAQINQQFMKDPSASQNAGLDAQMHAALESLSQVTKFTVLKMSNGTYSVYLGGQTPLVMNDQQFKISADFSQPQTAIRDSQGNDITAQVQDGTQGGSLGALLQEKNLTLPGYLNTLNTIAQTFADTVNGTLANGVDQNGNPPAANLFSYNAAQGAAATLSVTNITPSEIAAALPSAPGGNGNALAISQLASQPVMNGDTFTEAYGNLGGQVGTDVSTAQQNQTSAQNQLSQTQQQRQTQTGVSLDAQAALLLQFQQAYQATGKLITVLDSLTDTVMNMVPVTG